MQLQVLRRVSLVLLTLPLALATNQAEIHQEIHEAITTLQNSVSSYQGGLSGIPSLIVAMKDTWTARNKVEAYAASHPTLSEEDCAVAEDPSHELTNEMVDLLHLGREKIPSIAAVGKKAVAQSLIRPMYEHDTAYLNGLLSKCPDQAATIQDNINKITTAYEALLEATA
ncbi:hypothetical protein FQN54_005545 [Arachnomyces sp. PD_36]|nr:hypothetical protein FQN54_005545 [Arachnomyces sp. PD_36]